ncbi:MAG: GNAT family N-acetyltransferase [Patescibacteria group bacterium]|nr:GNAT family N-acetyltransferase [Patescibacteria group bacterium]
MVIKQKNLTAFGIKFYVEQGGKEVARAYLYLMKNDLHDQPFGYMEDVFVDEQLRGQGVGTELVKELIKVAKEKGCYKVVCTSRYGKDGVHRLYERLGFQDWGKEFRINLE